MSPWLKGVVLGFSIAAPVGPIGLLCLRRSITRGRTAGLVSGLGAATADALYGLVAALGLTAVTSFLLDHRIWLQGGGGLFLVYLGLATARARPATAAANGIEKAGLLGAFVSTFALTLANPMTILSFLAILAGVGSSGHLGAVGSAGWLVAGVFVGSAAWWLLLSLAAGWLGQRLERGGLRLVNVISGVVIAGFGLWQLVQLGRHSA